MPGPARVDVVLYGYRNDLARARVVEFVMRQVPADAGPAPLRTDTATPVRLYAGLEADVARVVAAHLDDLGAQVRVEAGPDLVASAVAPPRPAGGALAWVATAVVIAVLTAWVTPRLFQWRPAAPPLRPLAAAHDAPEPVSHAALAPSGQGADTGAAAPLVPVDADAFREQVEEIEAELGKDPDHPVLLRNLQTVLHNWGVAELNVNALDAAVEHLEAAAELGERAEVLQALGIARLRQGRDADAIPLLERALQLVPRERNALLALAEAYTHSDRRAEALELLQRARDTGSHEPELDRRIQQLGREVDAEWDFVEVHDPHFRVSFGDSGDSTSVQVMLDALDEAYYSVGGKFDSYPDGRTPVVLYAQQDFHAVTQTPDWASGAYDGRIKFPVRGLTPGDPQVTRIVRHEYAHSIIRRLAGTACPVWLNEGLAVWAEENSEGERVPWADDRISNRELFPLTQLNGSFVSLPADRIDVAYAQSYLAVRALVDRYGASRLRQLLLAIGRTGQFSAAFAEVYPEGFAAFEHEYIDDLTN